MTGENLISFIYYIHRFSNFDPKIADEIFAGVPTTTSSPNKSIPLSLSKDTNQCYMGISLPLSSCSLYPSSSTHLVQTASSFVDESLAASVGINERSITQVQSDQEKKQTSDTESERIATSITASDVDRTRETGGHDILWVILM